MRLTPTQVEELLSILDKYTFTFLAHHVGADILTDNQKRSLLSAGVSIQHIGRTAYNVEHAFKFGILSRAIGESAAKVMNYEQLKSYIESGKAFGLSYIEKQALQSLKYQTSSEILRLGEKIKDQIKTKLVEADLKRNTVKHNTIVTDAVKKAIQDKKYVSEIISEIGHQTGQWNKDLGRISDFVLHQAFDEGRAAGVVRDSGEDGLVYKDVYPGACPYCIKLYLTGGASSTPKVFKVSELKANGTNVGRKSSEWLPVIGALHPWCRCTLNPVPDGMTIESLRDSKWEWDGLVFKRVKEEEPRRDRSKVIVTIGNKIVKV